MTVHYNQDVADAWGRLEELRAAIRAEDISYGEIAELQDLASYVDRDDHELMMWAYSWCEDCGDPNDDNPDHALCKKCEDEQ